MLPSDFIFSQNNLQAYLDCPRRFFLHYIEHIDWPALESEPVLEQERLMQLGHDFHLLVQQFLSGIPAAMLADGIQDEDLQRWWRHFQALELDPAKGRYFVEETLTVPLAGYRLLAKVDLVSVGSDPMIQIYDWKTSQAEPRRDWLAKRAQSFVYPYVVARCSAALTGGQSVDPEELHMTYWYPEHPGLPVTFEYSEGQYASDEQKLIQLISEISSLEGESQFPKTDELKTCNYCKFRSLCERGGKAGWADEENTIASEEFSFDIDFESL